MSSKTDETKNGGSDAITDERRLQILDERARRLAIPFANRRDEQNDREMLLITVAQATYAVDCRYVRAAGRAAGITPIPGTPDFVAGAMRIRGEIHSVFDLRALLGELSQPESDDARVIAFGEHRTEFCLLVDETSAIVKLSASDIHPHNSARDQRETSFIQGITADAILVLDGAALLRDPKLYIGEARPV